MLVLQPAYGRDYKSKAAVQADFDADKDFVIASFGMDCGRYINKPQLNGKCVQIRYAKNTKSAVIS